MRLNPRTVSFVNSWGPLLLPMSVVVAIAATSFLRPADIGRNNVCDAAASELMNATNRLALDRAEFVIKWENCDLSSRVTGFGVAETKAHEE